MVKALLVLAVAVMLAMMLGGVASAADSKDDVAKSTDTASTQKDFIVGNVTTNPTNTPDDTIHYKFEAINIARDTKPKKRHHKPFAYSAKGTYSEKTDDGSFVKGNVKCLYVQSNDPSTQPHTPFAVFVVQVTNSSDHSNFPKGMLFRTAVGERRTSPLSRGPYGPDYVGFKDYTTKNCSDNIPQYGTTTHNWALENGFSPLQQALTGDIEIYFPYNNFPPMNPPPK